MGPLFLGPGRYLLSVNVGSREQDLIDSIDNAAWFEVDWNNYYENNEPFDEYYGPILRKSEWELVDCNLSAPKKHAPTSPNLT